jgi:hypothetical protein
MPEAYDIITPFACRSDKPLFAEVESRIVV